MAGAITALSVVNGRVTNAQSRLLRSTDLTAVVTAGTYTFGDGSITVDAAGRVTAVTPDPTDDTGGGVTAYGDLTGIPAAIDQIDGLTPADNTIPYYPTTSTGGLLGLDDDPTLAANSSTAVPTQAAVKGYVDDAIAAIPPPPPGVTDHAALDSLDYASSGHTGFAGTVGGNSFTGAQFFADVVSFSGDVVIAATGRFALLDLSDDDRLYIAVGEHLSIDRTLTIVTGDADRTLTLTGNATIGGTHSGTSSGTNTGDQTIALTGDVTGTGTGSFATTIAPGVVTNAKLRASAAFSVIGRASNSAGDPADIVAASDGQVLRRSGTSLGFGAVDLAGASAVTGTLAVARGGTGATTATAALAAILPAQSGHAGQVLGTDGTTAAWTAAGTGTVTSVGLSVPSWLSVSGSPVTGSGTLTVSAVGGLDANRVLATPSGATGAVSLRTLVAADLPDLSSTYQPLDADLTAVAGLSSVGLVARTGSGMAAARTLTGTPSRITVGNGDGVSGHPTVDVSSAYVGQSSITTVGTIGTGTWQGTAVAAQYGGTGLSSLPLPPLGRLTTESGVGVSSTDRTGQSTLYYTPHVGSLVCLYDGTRWVPWSLTELSLTLSGLTDGAIHDVFVYDSSGTLTLKLGPAWTSSTGRGTGAGTTELERLNGLWVNKVSITSGPGAQRGLYLGTIRATGTTTTEDSATRRYVWSAYHRVPRRLFVSEETSHSVGNIGSWRGWNAADTTRVEWVQGLAVDAVPLGINAEWNGQYVGIAYDSTSAAAEWLLNGTNGTTQMRSGTPYVAPPALGYHYAQAMEVSTVAGQTMTSVRLYGSIAG